MFEGNDPEDDSPELQRLRSIENEREYERMQRYTAALDLFEMPAYKYFLKLPNSGQLRTDMAVLLTPQSHVSFCDWARLAEEVGYRQQEIQVYVSCAGTYSCIHVCFRYENTLLEYTNMYSTLHVYKCTCSTSRHWWETVVATSKTSYKRCMAKEKTLKWRRCTNCLTSVSVQTSCMSSINTVNN